MGVDHWAPRVTWRGRLSDAQPYARCRRACAKGKLVERGTRRQPPAPARNDQGAEVARPAILVFAAASLTDVLQKLGADFGKSTGIGVKFVFAASSVLARQIEAGASADVFFSADRDWMDYLQARKLIYAELRKDLLGYSLVL